MEFPTTLVARGPAAAIVLTDVQLDELGGGRRPPVTVRINGRTERLRVARMGSENLIGLRKEVRASFGVAAGDQAVVQVELDEDERTVDVPADLLAALAAADLQAAFDALSYTRRREFAESITSAKRPDTRQRRIARVVDELQAARG